MLRTGLAGRRLAWHGQTGIKVLGGWRASKQAASSKCFTDSCEHLVDWKNSTGTTPPIPTPPIPTLRQFSDTQIHIFSHLCTGGAEHPFLPIMRRRTPVLLSLFLSALQLASAVKHADFKTCDQSGFCRRNRALADEATAAGSAWEAPFELDPASIKLSEGVLTGTVWKTVPEKDGGRLEFPLQVTVFDDGVARVTIDEARRQKGEVELRGGSKARKERYNEVEKWAIIGETYADAIFIGAGLDKGDSSTKVTYNYGQNDVVIQHKPFKVTLFRGGEAQIVLNERNFMNIEHWRAKEEKKVEKKVEEAEKEAEKEGEKKEAEEEKKVEESGPDQSTWWDESFGGNTDSKPKGSFKTRLCNTLACAIHLLIFRRSRGHFP